MTNHAPAPVLIFNRKQWQYVLAAWVVMWIFFFCKDLLTKGYLNDYKELLARPTLEGKRSWVTGDRLYELIQLCRTVIPENATFGYDGIKDQSLSDWRTRYYLYPRLRSDDPDYLIVFGGTAGARPDRGGWRPYKSLDRERFILKKAP
ncbi:MAG: hypothetical protein PHS37_08690 [Candidatus Omnitrophica bacterium]|nr:hypothetical protein [Candidatus Omnitrophota bacterium]